MNKQTFLAQLRKGLSSLSEAEREERLLFYSEMIDDRMEEGLSEEEAILGIGSVESLLAQILGDAPTAPKKHTGRLWNTILLILGAPVWFSLLVSAFAAAISLYAALWSVIISLWACFGALVGCALGGILAANKLVDFRLKRLETVVEKHNQVMERTFKLEGQMAEVQHEIVDLKKYHLPMVP